VGSGVQRRQALHPLFIDGAPTTHRSGAPIFFSRFPPATPPCAWPCWVTDGVGARAGPCPFGRGARPCPDANGSISPASKSHTARAVVTHRRLFSFAVRVSAKGQRERGCVHAERRPGLRCPALAWHGMGADAALCSGGLAGFWLAFASRWWWRRAGAKPAIAAA